MGRLRPIMSAVLLLAAATLLVGAILVFAFHNFCEDACDKPPWTFGSALSAATPWALAGLAALIAAIRTSSTKWRHAVTYAIAAVAVLWGGLAVLTATPLLGAGYWPQLAFVVVWVLAVGTLVLRRT
jgi:hypothetical protein